MASHSKAGRNLPYPTVVWFGPPGVGKSTFIQKVGGFDLEHFPTRQARDDYIFAGWLRVYEHVGAADTSPSQYDPEFYTRILVLPPRSIYDRRRKRRDSRNAAKRRQGDYYDAFNRNRTSFDYVVADFPDLSNVDVFIRRLSRQAT